MVLLCRISMLEMKITTTGISVFFASFSQQKNTRIQYFFRATEKGAYSEMRKKRIGSERKKMFIM